ncbi:MAG: UbiX family flavin prenyltransferase [Candidatus Hodarchaeales archaeon]|jgi:4-hydroxy-3-polyprenylbenzoate decarboxylase
MNKKTSESTPLIVALTGASGIGYGIRLIQALIDHHYPPYLILSRSAEIVAKVELKIDITPYKKLVKKVYSNENIAAEVASGSFVVNNTAGMCICPTSMKTLALIAHGIEMNLIVRAAMCQLKEGKNLVLVPRETPLSLQIIENMRLACLSGAILLPAMPAFYQQPKNIEDLEKFIVGKILDQFRIPHDLYRRWGD